MQPRCCIMSVIFCVPEKAATAGSVSCHVHTTFDIDNARHVLDRAWNLKAAMTVKSFIAVAISCCHAIFVAKMNRPVLNSCNTHQMSRLEDNLGQNDSPCTRMICMEIESLSVGDQTCYRPWTKFISVLRIMHP